GSLPGGGRRAGALRGGPNGAALGLPRGEDRLGQDAGALVALVRLLVAEGQTDVALAARAGEERAPRGVLHARLQRQRLELGDIRGGRQVYPDDETATGGA